MSDYDKRIETLRGRLRPGDGFLVTDMKNVRYLTGFTGSSGFVFLAGGKSIFVTDSRYDEQARAEVAGDIMIEKTGRAAVIRGLIRKNGAKRLSLESTVSYEFFEKVSAAVSPVPVRVLKGAAERQRAVKDVEELQLLNEAVRRAERAFLEVKPYIRPGMRERAIALRLEERLKKAGCRRIPFDIIVASGANSAMPHAGASDKRLAAGDLVVIDWGGEAGGYFSDITRTLLLRGRDMGRKREICGIVHRANRKGISAVRAGMKAGEIDNAARNVIKKAGYGDYFGHSLGHGVGLAVHELPFIRRRGGGRLREGMVFTIEPGVYLPGIGGVRVEDMVRVGKKGGLRMTSLPSEPEII